MRAWLDTVKVEEGCDPLEAAAQALGSYISNRTDQRRRGRHVRRGLREVRRVVPYICPDLSRYPRGYRLFEDADGTDEVMVDWIRSGAFVRMMDIVTSREPESLRMRGGDGTVEAFYRDRHRRFVRLEVVFEKGNPDYRRAVATFPGTLPGGRLVKEVTGFAERDEEVLTAWLGEATPDAVRAVNVLDDDGSVFDLRLTTYRHDEGGHVIATGNGPD